MVWLGPSVLSHDVDGLWFSNCIVCHGGLADKYVADRQWQGKCTVEVG
ncbi:hypothetical protein [Photorhabdus akhurstii]|nr:hypothetical protein [Photorhabdus akhurstii]